MAIDIGKAPRSTQQPGPAKKFNLNMQIQLGSRRIGTAERVLFTERLVLLLETGVTLAEALDAIKSQIEDPRLAGIVGSLADSVTEGKSFSEALSGHPEMFSQTYRSLVAVAEEGGFLPKVLDQLRDMDEKSSQMRSSMISALSYPAFLIVFSVVVVIFVLVFIFPKFGDLFQSIHNELPATTIFLMFLSDLLRNHWLLILLALGAGLAVLFVWGRTPAAQRLADQLKVRTPVIRDIFVQAYLQQALGILGMSLTNGLSISVALDVSKGVIGNRVFRDFLDDVQRRINEGETVAAGFVAAGFIPPMVRQMIATGEQTGNLGKVMTRVAEFYGRELSKRLAALSRMVEPIMLMVMGVVVGVVVASLILPIFKLSRAIH